MLISLPRTTHVSGTLAKLELKRSASEERIRCNWSLVRFDPVVILYMLLNVKLYYIIIIFEIKVVYMNKIFNIK